MPNPALAWATRHGGLLPAVGGAVALLAVVGACAVRTAYKEVARYARVPVIGALARWWFLGSPDGCVIIEFGGAGLGQPWWQRVRNNVSGTVRLRNTQKHALTVTAVTLVVESDDASANEWRIGNVLDKPIRIAPGGWASIAVRVPAPAWMTAGCVLRATDETRWTVGFPFDDGDVPFANTPPAIRVD